MAKKKKASNPPKRMISLMGEIFTHSELKRIQIMWIVIPKEFRDKYPKTYKRFSSILSMMNSLADEIENNTKPENRLVTKDWGDGALSNTKPK